MASVSTAPAKYLFDTSFDAPGTLSLVDLRPAAAELEPEPDAQPEPEPPPEPTYGAAELAAAEETGFATGHAAGLSEALAAIETRRAQATERLAAGLADLAAQHAEAMERVERQAVEFALAAVRKLFPELRRRGAAAEIEALIEECLNQAIDEPRIIVRCSESQIETLKPSIDAIARRAGFDGKLVVLPDPRCSEADCRLEWADGGADRDSARLMAEIEAVVSRGLGPDRHNQGSLDLPEPEPVPEANAEPAEDILDANTGPSDKSPAMPPDLTPPDQSTLNQTTATSADETTPTVTEASPPAPLLETV
jgi:flagellar assembly protein FliH